MSSARPSSANTPANPYQHIYKILRLPWLLLVLLLVALAVPFIPPGSVDHLLGKNQGIGTYGVFVVAALGLVLAVWRFGLEDRKTSAAESHAQATRDQADAMRAQAKAARDQACMAKAQIDLAVQQMAGASDLADAAKQHSEAARKMADVALQRASLDDQAFLHDRYQRAARMLGDDVQAVRIGGVYLLDRLAREHPTEYHIEVMRLFSSFVRHQDNMPVAPPAPGDNRLRADVQAVVHAIGTRDTGQLDCEADFMVDLEKSDLQGADLRAANLLRVNLKGARLERADVTGARFDKANLTDTVVADLGAKVIGLEQEQLDSCFGTSSGAPAGLEHLRDLTWRPPT